MKSIKFKAAYGDEQRKGVISQVSGSQNGVRIFINDYYLGSVVKVFGNWVVHWVERQRKAYTKTSTAEMIVTQYWIDLEMLAGLIENNHHMCQEWLAALTFLSKG